MARMTLHHAPGIHMSTIDRAASPAFSRPVTAAPGLRCQPVLLFRVVPFGDIWRG